MPNIQYIDANTLLIDSLKLGKKIYNKGYIPTHAISLWRGGTPVGLGVGEYFRLKGHRINHTTVATSSYDGINSQQEVIIKGLEHVIKAIAKEDKLLIIDDVYDSGNTIEAIIEAMRESARANMPEQIMVACIHNKLKDRIYDHNIISVYDIDQDIWLCYPHELSELLSDTDKDQKMIRDKSKELFKILERNKPYEIESVTINDEAAYIHSDALLMDAFKLAVNVFESGFHPDFIIAIWPGGIHTGIPVHEYFKYRIRRDNLDVKVPDHISINTSLSHYSYEANIIGIRYLEEKINAGDKILLIDTAFQTGRLSNQTIDKLVQLLRRNITVKNIKIASVYYTPNIDVTFTRVLWYKEPHYYLKKMSKEIVFPYQIHRLINPEKKLKSLNPEMHNVLFSEDD